MADDRDEPAFRVSRRVRFEVLRRDGHKCRYCGCTAEEAPLTVDHVVPRALGGSNDSSNLVTACGDCNSGKTSTSPDEHVVADVDAKALAWVEAMRVAADTRRAEFQKIDNAVAEVIGCWDGYTYAGPDDERLSVPKDANWRASLERFLSAGLEATDMVRLVEAAMTSQAFIDRKWRYFCGCCWNEINARQELALNVLSRPTDDVEPSTSPEYDSGYDDGFYDGRGYGYQGGYVDGRNDALREFGDESESAYERGYRAGANRRHRYEETTCADPELEHDE